MYGVYLEWCIGYIYVSGGLIWTTLKHGLCLWTQDQPHGLTSTHDTYARI